VADLSDCLTRVNALLDLTTRKSDGVTSAFDQVRIAVEQKLAGNLVDLEHKVDGFSRTVDVALTKATGELQHVEVKAGKAPIGTQLSGERVEEQLVADARIAVDRAVENIWAFTRTNFTEASRESIQEAMRNLRDEVKRNLAKDLGVSGPELTEAFQTAMKSFSFVDAAGRVIELEFSGNRLDAVFREGFKILLAPDGSIARTFTEEAGNSPNFKPGMELLLGPSGKMANAATQAAEGANFTTAQTELEQKVEKSVTTALEGAGTAAAEKAGTKVGEKVAGGLTALGNVLTSIPQLYSSVKSLGEAWDKPNKNAGDYMTIMSSLGGVVMGVGQTIQAFSAIQEIATGVQAAFNAVAAMNPYVLIALAVIALIAGIVLLIVYWDKVKAAIRDNPWIAVIAVMFGVIGVIILVIAYWDEIKLAVLKAANFVSIQMQRVGGFFIGVKNLAGMVWDWIVATVENVGIGILNAFITIGVGIQNFFIGVINWVLKQYNKVADSAIGSVLGLSKAALLPEVDVKTKLIPPKEVPKVDVEAAFKPMTEEKTGGLEGQIAKQQGVVDKAKKDDEDRRAKEAKEKADKEKAAAAPPGAPAGLAPPAIPGMPPGAPGVPAAFAGPPGAGAAAPAAPGGGGVTIQGGITVNINADKLEADASKMLSDEIVQALNTKLQALQGDANRRLGVAAA
jgi:hypothetical protein